MSQKSFKLFFDQHWIGRSIAFSGDQEEGLQVMGLLKHECSILKQLLPWE